MKANKTNIVGWLIIIIVSPLLLLRFSYVAIFPIIFLHGGSMISNHLQSGLVPLFLGVFSLEWGSSLRKHKKWAWYIGIVVFPISAFMFLGFSFLGWLSLIPLALSIFSFLALFLESESFFTT